MNWLKALLLTLPTLSLANTGVDADIVPSSGVQFEQLKIKAMPAYQPARCKDGSYESISRQDIVTELRLLTGINFNERGQELLPAPLPRISCRYEAYSSVTLSWFRKFIFWFDHQMRALGLTYRKDDWDCDDYSLALNAMADLAFLQSKDHPPPQLIGRLIVRQIFPWGGTPAAIAHEITIFRSDTGWYVAEPQSGRVDPLRDYPNRKHILEILFN